ncbi:MAG: 3-deoxy-D-manno-octulosonic acid transferase, partial [Francisellaceae bacterium]|nr:3-deoxy-D-manno-octulosonic acid transferase [Francisellaceae bacterium]
IKVKELIKKHNFSMICRTDNSLVQQDIEVFLGDTMGELNFYYGLSQVAFIGGSLVPIGGHNMLEAALYAIPILSGPHLNNFLDISQKLIESEAMLIVRSAQELSLALLQWLEDCKARKQLGLKAETVVLKNQGAVLKIAYKINEFL